MPSPMVALMEGAKRVGVITDADLASVMDEARRIFAAEVGDDDGIPGDFREWACLGIAANIIARSRGFDVSRVECRPITPVTGERDEDIILFPHRRTS